MLLNALICYSNALKVWMQSDLPFCQWSSSRKGNVISPIQVKEILAAESLCRSVGLIIGRTALNSLVIYEHRWTSSITFQNIKFLIQTPFY